MKKNKHTRHWLWGLGLALSGFVVSSRRHPQNFLDPKFPLLEGPGRGAEAVGAPTLNRDTFSLVSFNIHFGYEPEKVVATLRENGMAASDVLLLQESDDKSVRLISEALHMGYVYYPATVHPTSGNLFGVAVLSRWPIRASRKILLPSKSLFDAARKVCVATTIEIDHVLIEVVNVHLQSGLLRRAFREQIESAVRCALHGQCEGDPDPEPLPPARARVFAGDFNTWETGLQKGLEETMRGIPLKRVDGIVGTFSKGSDQGRGKHTMDYIFVSPELYLKSGRVGASRTGSDHHPIEAELRLPKPESGSR